MKATPKSESNVSKKASKSNFIQDLYLQQVASKRACSKKARRKRKMLIYMNLKNLAQGKMLRSRCE
jgi:hypothetical protein